jgi:hypothetical protein
MTTVFDCFLPVFLLPFYEQKSEFIPAHGLSGAHDKQQKDRIIICSCKEYIVSRKTRPIGQKIKQKIK